MSTEPLAGSMGLFPAPRGPRGRNGTIGDGRALERPTFMLSLDFALAWGRHDLAEDLEPLQHAARITREQVFEPLLHLLLDLDIPATWATVGHLFLDHVEADAFGVVHGDMVPPHHAWQTRPWYEHVPAGSEDEAPAWMAHSLVRRLAAAGMDIGSQGFSHVVWGDEGCSPACAESELRRAVEVAHAMGIELRSFAFPRNRPGHVELLAKHGFTSWRPPEPAWYRRWAWVPEEVGRAAHLAEVFSRRPMPVVLPWRDRHGLWCIPGSGRLLPLEGVRGIIPTWSRVARATAGVDLAIEQRGLAHLTVHPMDFAAAPERMLGALREILEHVARLRDHGELDVYSMDGLVERLERRD